MTVAIARLWGLGLLRRITGVTLGTSPGFSGRVCQLSNRRKLTDIVVGVVDSLAEVGHSSVVEVGRNLAVVVDNRRAAVLVRERKT